MVQRRHFLAVLAAVVFGCGCSQAPTGPAPSVSAVGPVSSGQYSGVWRVDYRVTDCRGDRQCVHSLGDTYEVYLRLEQTGSAVVGVFRPGRSPVSAYVTGTVTQDGALILHGRMPAASPYDPWGEVELTRLDVRPAAFGVAFGEVEHVVRYPPQSGVPMGSVTRSGDVLRFVRLSASAASASFSGAWVGRSIMRTCDTTGWTVCRPGVDQIEWLEINLDEASGQVSGQWGVPGQWGKITITGRASGDRLEFAGILDEIISGGRTETRISGTATRDQLGRLSGRFVVTETIFWTNPSPNGFLVYTTTNEAELYSVILMPVTQ